MTDPTVYQSWEGDFRESDTQEGTMVSEVEFTTTCWNIIFTSFCSLKHTHTPRNLFWVIWLVHEDKSENTDHKDFKRSVNQASLQGISQSVQTGSQLWLSYWGAIPSEVQVTRISDKRKRIGEQQQEKADSMRKNKNQKLQLTFQSKMFTGRRLGRCP